MEKELRSHCCCFFGHRRIIESAELIERLRQTVVNLICTRGVDTFLFGSRSEFDTLCHKVVSELRITHPHIKRIYVRAEFPYINKNYTDYLLEHYERTYYPERILNAGKSAYVERNYEMIDNSDYCVIYFDENYSARKSGTKIAHDYAIRKKLSIYNLAN